MIKIKVIVLKTNINYTSVCIYCSCDQLQNHIFDMYVVLPFSVGTAGKKLYTAVVGTHITAVKSARCNTGRNIILNMTNTSRATHLSNLRHSRLLHRGPQVLIRQQGQEEAASTFR